MLFKDIPQFTQCHYAVDVAWSYLSLHLERAKTEYHLDLDPDFQRGHVWTPEKQTRFVEFCLRGGASANNVYFNCAGFNLGRSGDYVLVDGKQRITAVLDFLGNRVPVFGGHLFGEFEDKLRMTGPSFRWHVNDLETRAEVLQWYIELNSGGVIHTDEEIERVKALLQKEKEK